MFIKKIPLLAAVVVLLSVALVSAFAAPKKKSGGKGGASDITCADVWAKKSKDFAGKTVTTFVLEIREAGTAMSDAPAAVVPVETGDKSQNPGGEIYVLVAPDAFSGFAKKYAPAGGDADSSFGGKIEHRQLSGVFAIVGGENVLLLGVEASALADFSPEKALEKQLKAAGSASAIPDAPDGFSRKNFYVSKLGKKPYTPAEFKRLVALYNKDKPKDERMKERDVKAALEDGDGPFVVLDEKAKIQWVLRR